MSRPAFYVNDRFFVGYHDTWWIGTGENFDPDSIFPMPHEATSFITVTT